MNVIKNYYHFQDYFDVLRVASDLANQQQVIFNSLDIHLPQKSCEIIPFVLSTKTETTDLSWQLDNKADPMPHIDWVKASITTIFKRNEIGLINE